MYGSDGTICAAHHDTGHGVSHGHSMISICIVWRMPLDSWPTAHYDVFSAG